MPMPMPMPKAETERPPAVLSFRTDAGEHERIQRAAADAGVSPSEYLRALVRKGGDMRRGEEALLNALRATGSTVWIDVKRARGDKPPTARVARLHGGDVSSIAQLEVQPISGGRYALSFAGVGELAGARIVLAALPAKLAATLEVPLASLGDNLLESI